MHRGVVNFERTPVRNPKTTYYVDGTVNNDFRFNQSRTVSSTVAYFLHIIDLLLLFRLHNISTLCFAKFIRFDCENLSAYTFFPDKIMSVLQHLKKAYSCGTSGIRSLHSSAPCCRLMKLSRLRVVDNSELGKQAMMEGKPPYIIHVYNKTGIGTVGDVVLCAIKGQKKKGVIVGCKAQQPVHIPRTDSNNVVLIEDSGAPLGTRIVVPVPSCLRTILKKKTFAKGADYTKVLSIATRFV